MTMVLNVLRMYEGALAWIVLYVLTSILTIK